MSEKKLRHIIDALFEIAEPGSVKNSLWQTYQNVGKAQGFILSTTRDQPITPQKQQVLANIETVIDYLKYVPGVTDVDVEEPLRFEEPLDGDRYEKKVWLTFVGCPEVVVLEIY